MAQVNNAKIPITASYWPSFLYDETEYDDRCTEKGLCHGCFLLWVRNTCSFIISILLSMTDAQRAIVRIIMTLPTVLVHNTQMTMGGMDVLTIAICVHQ
jgi:hypothetical protein